MNATSLKSNQNERDLFGVQYQTFSLIVELLNQCIGVVCLFVCVSTRYRNVS